ncbi:hypothetical protein PENTCL1PPCAC_6979, partial [Pristionchus entomophagus]
YRAIRKNNIFGMNLESICEKKDIDIIRAYLPPRTDEYGNTIVGAICLQIPPHLLNAPRALMTDACGKLQIHLPLKEVGFTPALIRTNLVRFKVTIRGIQRDQSGNIDVVGGLVRMDGTFSNYMFFDQERVDGEITSWGRELILRVETPLVHSEDCDMDRLHVHITLKNEFALLSVDIRATTNHD